MAKNLISISLILLFISACAKPTYEGATKWYSECVPHRRYHPGDWVAVQDECHKDCTEHFYNCVKPCIEKGYSIAEHLEGGYYSDGSYYATCNNIFENIHPTRDKYEKTQWQKDRDVCMELTFENVKLTWWVFKNKSMRRAKNYYKSCLRERGYKFSN
jgi:hypothetical protein